MIALPQCCSTSFRWSVALHMLHLEENISMETTTAAHRGEGGIWASGFYFVGQ